ncbi:GFA family protein [Hyphococcus luteus]|uniref:Aldehyde-activating protein n=1 Tax=Hyphococcus luteus TaxID=2058213 RepID=A0A2S7K367_9PROT|nr:GFA family protein [Marinicaulis flavus]PQA86943.1 aldehyde-activating protein [Marinicaulis flavus]
MSESAKLYHGSCHCDAVAFTANLTEGLSKPRRCTCSICRMRGAVAVSAKLDDLNVTRGEDKLSLYQFNTGTAKHYFCSICGIYTHHQRRSDPSLYAVNIACLEGVSPFDFEEVEVYDGVAAHTSDTGGKPVRAGVLKFIKD